MHLRGKIWWRTIPFALDRSTIDVKFGYQHDQKARTYAHREFGLGSVDASDAVLQGGIATILSDANIGLIEKMD